jgi:hypothetical protein
MADDNGQEPTHVWGKLEAIGKFLAGISAVVGAVLIPVLLNSYTEKNRQAEMFVRTMTEREKSDTDIRQSMFQSLLTGYLGAIKEDFVRADEDSFRRRIVFLELLTINFQEFFNAKPLFEDVFAGLERKRALAQSPAEQRVWSDLEEKIIRVAKNIVSRQSSTLNNIGTGVVFSIQNDKAICVRLFDRNDLKTLRNTDHKSFESYTPDTCGGSGGEDIKGSLHRQSLEIRPVAVDTAYATVQVVIYENQFVDNVLQTSLRSGTSRFDISYFDLPYMDNIKMNDGSRFSLILRKTFTERDRSQSSAEIEAVHFRNDFMSLRDRPLFEEMLQKLEQKTP